MTTTYRHTIAATLTALITRDDVDDVAGGELQTVHSKQVSESLTPDTTLEAAGRYAKRLTGSTNLDLTALADDYLGTVDHTGQKVVAVGIYNDGDGNESDVVVDDGASNAYQLNGGDAFTVPPGAWLVAYFDDELADVASDAKAIAITAGAGEDFLIVLFFGE